MWLVIGLISLLAVGAGAWYLISRIRKLGFVQKVAKERAKLSWLIATSLLLLLSAILVLAMDTINMMVCLLHLGGIWAICDIVAWFYHKLTKKARQSYLVGYVAILLTGIVLAIGWYYAHHVYETPYDFETAKELEAPLHIVQISDSHVGATFHKEEFAEYMQQINAMNPDVVVITGDFVDDDTTKEDMLGCCEALSTLKTKYGVYFCYGNHDRGYYASKRGYSGEDLERELVKNGVVVLIDEAVLVDNRFYIIGREDSSRSGRASMEELLQGLDTSKYMVVLDHEPQDYANQEKAGVDLVLSGHTHGGQLIPIIKVGEWFGINDMTYGHKKAGNTDFVVSSGISCWAIKFKTGCISEINSIHIQ